MNRNNEIPGYNPYFDDGSMNDKYSSGYETMNKYVDASGYGDSMPNYPEVALQRQTSSKKLLEKETAREDTMKKLTKGDSEKKMQTLNKFDPTNTTVKK